MAVIWYDAKENYAKLWDTVNDMNGKCFKQCMAL